MIYRKTRHKKIIFSLTNGTLIKKQPYQVGNCLQIGWWINSVRALIVKSYSLVILVEVKMI